MAYTVTKETIKDALKKLCTDNGGFYRIYDHASKKSLVFLYNRLNNSVRHISVASVCSWNQLCVFLRMEIETLQGESIEDYLHDSGANNIFELALLNILVEHELTLQGESF